jgi:hypothetical protein
MCIDKDKYLLINVDGVEVFRVDSEGKFFAMGVEVTQPEHVVHVQEAAKKYAEFVTDTWKRSVNAHFSMGCCGGEHRDK